MYVLMRRFQQRKLECVETKRDSTIDVLITENEDHDQTVSIIVDQDEVSIELLKILTFRQTVITLNKCWSYSSNKFHKCTKIHYIILVSNRLLMHHKMLKTGWNLVLTFHFYRSLNLLFYKIDNQWKGGCFSSTRNRSVVRTGCYIQRQFC